MCGRFTLRKDAREIADAFGLPLAACQLALRYNIAPTQDVAVIRATNHGRELAMMRWGLIPSWAADTKIGNRTINARCETATEKPSVRSAMKKRRCLIPGDGFYEWRKQGKKEAAVLHSDAR